MLHVDLMFLDLVTFISLLIDFLAVFFWRSVVEREASTRLVVVSLPLVACCLPVGCPVHLYFEENAKMDNMTRFSTLKVEMLLPMCGETQLKTFDRLLVLVLGDTTEYDHGFRPIVLVLVG